MLRRALVILACVLAPWAAPAQIFVQPERAYKGRVRHFELDWQVVDLEPMPAQGGGVRLYFYDRERQIAEWAVASIEQSYRELADAFHHVPNARFPYILYSAYQEFLETNLFPLEEGVLGVTSPIDLTLTLPYFGDHRLFRRVSKHELAHQFTIQKLRSLAAAAKVANPLSLMPLWFIEGLAEFYTHGGWDDEAKLAVRDRILNSEGRYQMHGFFEDRPYDVGWTYKIGQARVVFLAETYGASTVQRILDRSITLAPATSFAAVPTRTFEDLVASVTLDSPREIDARWDEWTRENAYEVFISARQGGRAPRAVWGAPERIGALAASPDGHFVLYRTTDPLTGISSLGVMRADDPERQTDVAADGRPGVESLHPIEGRNFDIGQNALVFVAEVGGTDALYRQSYERGDDGDIELGERVGFDLLSRGIIAAFAPVLSPDGTRIAFIGLRGDGVRDVYVLHPIDGGFRLEQLTRDAWGERDLAWASDGILFTADATEHGRYNVFRVRPDEPERVARQTTAAVDQEDLARVHNRVFFVAAADGRYDLYELLDGRTVRRTSAATGYFAPQPGPDGDVFALEQRAGKRRLVRAAEAGLIAAEAHPIVVGDAPRPLETAPLTGAREYRSAAIDNWKLGNVFGVLGAGDGIYGQLFATATDRLHNHLVILSFTALGRFALTDGFALYVDQSGWSTWGLGAFQAVNVKLDRTFDALSEDFISFERFYGGMGLYRLPFNTFQYLETQIAVGAVDYFIRSGARSLLRDPIENGAGRSLLPDWRAANAGPRFQSEATVRLGHDTVRYHPGTGPFDGSSLLLEASGASQPFEDETFGHLRFDVQRYVPIRGSANFALRGAVGAATGGALARQFFLSSFDTLRGVPFGDTDFLVGSTFAFVTGELQVPLTRMFAAGAYMPGVEGVLGADFGGVADRWSDLGEKRVFDAVVGANLLLGGLVLRVHFAKPFDVDAPAGQPAGGDWVTNLSLGWIYW